MLVTKSSWWQVSTIILGGNASQSKLALSKSLGGNQCYEPEVRWSLSSLTITNLAGTKLPTSPGVHLRIQKVTESKSCVILTYKHGSLKAPNNLFLKQENLHAKLNFN
jgi:hypothetical protein